MKKTSFAQEGFSPYLLAVRVHELVLPLAQTVQRSINLRLLEYCNSLLLHMACASAEQSQPGRARRLQFARLALTKLVTMVDVARRMGLVTEAQVADVRQQLLSVEETLDEHAVGTAPRAATEPTEPTEVTEPTEPTLASSSEGLPEDVMAELHELVERDVRPAPARSPTEEVGLEPGG